MSISHKDMDEAHKAHKKWVETASVEELRVFHEKCNPIESSDEYYRASRRVLKKKKDKIGKR